MATWNVTVVKRWVELATVEEIANAIDKPSSAGTVLCMAAALKKDHEAGKTWILKYLGLFNCYSVELWLYMNKCFKLRGDAFPFSSFFLLFLYCV